MTSRVPIFSEEGRLLNEPGARIVAFLTYPDDERSREQLFQLMVSELRHSEAVGANRYEPSALSRTIEGAVLKGAQARAAAGLVTLAFWKAATSGDKGISRYRASQDVEAAVRLASKVNRRPLITDGLEGGETFETRLRVASGRADIERRFVQHHKIGPLMAAQFVYHENTPLTYWAEGLRLLVREYIATAAEIERVVLEAYPHYFPDLIRLGPLDWTEVRGISALPIAATVDSIFAAPN